MSDEQKQNKADEENKNQAKSDSTPSAESSDSQKSELTAAPEAKHESVTTPEAQELAEEEKRIAEQEEQIKQKAEEEALEAEEVDVLSLKPGMTVRVHHKITEGEKERIQVFQGMIIALRGKTLNTKTMTVQKNSFGVRVERIFPLASPLIEKIEFVKIAKVRRSKLYYLADYTKRLKETFVK